MICIYNGLCKQMHDHYIRVCEYKACTVSVTVFVNVCVYFMYMYVSVV